MAWYNSINNSNCIFVIDGNSVITNSNTITTPSVVNSQVTVHDSTASVYNIPKTGFKILNNNLDISYYYTYKTIDIKKKNLLFKDPLSLPDTCTIVLMVQQRTNSQWMETVIVPSAGSGRGGPYQRVNDRNWNVEGINCTSTLPSIYTKNSFDGFDVVIIQINRLESLLKVITTYGTFSVTTNFPETVFGTNSYLYNVIGDNNNSAYYPDGYLVAFGIFNKIFTEQELEILKAEIDNDLLIYKTSINLNTDIELETQNTSLLQVSANNIDKISFTNHIKPFNLEYNLTIDSEINITDVSTNTYKNISDYVFKENVPVSVKLFLYERQSGELLYTTISDSNGYFEFKNLDSTLEYIITSNDDTYQFKSIIKNYNKE